MKIGRVQIILFKNIWLGGKDTGKPTKRFYIRVVRRRISFCAFGYCLMIDIKRKRLFKSGKPISIQEFASIMKKRGVDLSKLEAVEISVNGIKPLKEEY